MGDRDLKPAGRPAPEDPIDTSHYYCMGNEEQWEIIANILEPDECEILKLHIIGCGHKEIAEIFKKDRTTISKRWKVIQGKLRILKIPQYERDILTPEEIKAIKHREAQRKHYHK